MFEYDFQGQKIYFFRLNESQHLCKPSAERTNKIQQYQFVETFENIVHNVKSIDKLIAQHILLHHRPQYLNELNETVLILYKRKIVYSDPFESGVKIAIEMYPCTKYHLNENTLIAEKIFTMAFKPIIFEALGKMCTNVFIEQTFQYFLTTLKKSPIENAGLNDVTISGHAVQTLSPNGRYEKLKQQFALAFPNHMPILQMADENIQRRLLLKYEEFCNLTPRACANIQYTIAGNMLSSAISLNVFNVVKNEPAQQNSLNIKKASSAQTNVNKLYIRLHRNQLLNNEPTITTTTTTTTTDAAAAATPLLLSGRFYWTFEYENYVFAEFEMERSKMIEFVLNEYFTLVKIIRDDVNVCKFYAAIYKPYFQKFRQIKKNYKLIQFKMIYPERSEFIEIQTLTNLCSNIKGWQYIDLRLLNKANKTYKDTKTMTRNYEIYGAFSHRVVLQLARITNCGFLILRVNKFEDIIFYYVRFYICKTHICEVLTEHIPRWSSSSSLTPQQRVETVSMLKALWLNRPEACLLYHNAYFWTRDAINEINAKEKEEQSVKALAERADADVQQYQCTIDECTLLLETRRGNPEETSSLKKKRNVAVKKKKFATSRAKELKEQLFNIISQNFDYNVLRFKLLYVTIRNYIIHKFIIETGNISITNLNATNAINMVRIELEIRRSFARDCDIHHGNMKLETNTRLKLLGFSPISGKHEGPLSSIVSIRSLETTGKLLEKKYSELVNYATDITNVMIMLNMPRRSGLENPMNSMVFA